MSIKTNKPPMPGLLWGTYPVREKPQKNHNLISSIPLINSLINKGIESRARQTISHARNQLASTPPFNSNAYQNALSTLQTNLRRDGFTDTRISEAFALVGKAYSDTMQIELFDTQLLGAYYILNNRLAEMATGEGKTYAVALAAATAALCGVPVHIITANDYLAERDAQKLKILYQALGLKVDAAIKGQNPGARQLAYAADITYCTAKELAFDYLRDQLTKHHLPANMPVKNSKAKPFLRGLCMAIIDEADSILIDEASVPLILSEADNLKQQQTYYTQSLSIASQLLLNKDFVLMEDRMQVNLTHVGQKKLEATAMALPAVWHNKLHREESVTMALAALYLYARDHHYVVHNGTVSMIDHITGRIAEGRSWSGGLQQLIELKEGCKPSDKLSTIAQITFQRFFPKYLKLGGISGTLTESSNELQKTYGLSVHQVPLRNPSQRQLLPMRIDKNIDTRNQALITYVKQLHATGRPILIATASVQESEQLSVLMAQHKLKHNILNAKHDKQEADLISQAGKQYAITITTNMAGRGTDIHVSDAVNQLGGIHVISCQVNGSKRVDRQLIGRTARQGQAGSAEIWLTLESKLIKQRLPNWLIQLCSPYIHYLPKLAIQLMLTYVQWKESAHQAALRQHLMKSDQALKQHLAFGGQYD